MNRRWAPAVLAAALLLTGCGSDAEGGDDPTVSAPSAAASTAAPTPCESAPPTQEPRPSTGTDLATEPVVEGSDAPPPCGLVVRDVVVGTGAEVVAGAQVKVKYVGAFYETGEQFDASWDISPETTLPFVAAGGNLIQGFDQGVVGMKAGGRREIVIPSDLGYGPRGTGPIPGGATLVFVVDVVDVQGP